MSNVKPRPIRNNRIKRDFKRLLTLLANAELPNTNDYAEIEEIAKRNGLYFDDNGIVKEVRHDRQNNR